MAMNNLVPRNAAVKGRRQSYVLEAVLGILYAVVGNFIYDKAKANWNRIKPILVRVAKEAVIAIPAGVAAILMISYLPLAP